jgi:hypothetical protein
VAIASFGGDETTLAKSFIISLENAATDWYARLPPRSITSWAQLKEKFLVYFQGFQVDISTKEDFFLLPAVRTGDTTRNFPQIPSNKSASLGGLR